MGDIVDFSAARPGPDRPAADGRRGDVVIFPITAAKSGWLRREGLRIAANVNGASLFNVRRILRLEADRAGLSGPAVDGEIERAVAFVEAVADAARAIGAPAGPGQRGGAA